MPDAIDFRPCLTVAPHTRPPLVILAAMLTATVASAAIARLGFAGGELLPLAFAFGELWLVGWALRRMGASRCGDAVQAITLFLVVGVLTGLVSAAIASLAMPLADGWLAALDTPLLMGASWPGMIAAMQPFERTLLALGYAYTTLGWQPIVLIAALSALGEDRAMWRFVTAWGATLLICLAVFVFCPATGAYAHFGIAPVQVPSVRVHAAWDFLDLFERLRAGHVHRLGTSTMCGMITMPSFHTAAAVLLGWGFWRVPVLRWPFGALNVAMLLSAVPMGGHYIVDVLAGAAAAVAGIALAHRAQAAVRHAVVARPALSPVLAPAG